MSLLRPLCFTLVSAAATASAAAAPGCFDDWFCYKVDNTSGEVSVYRTRPYPVVVTLTAGLDNTPVVTELADDTPVSLGQADSAQRFWHTMRVTWAPGVLGATPADVTYRYPLQPRGDYAIVQGPGGSYSHTGRSYHAVDIAAPPGTPIYAARAGTVIDIKEDSDQGGPDESFADLANYIIVLHDDGTTGEYYHLQQDGVDVVRGQQVAAGEPLGRSGNTGFSSLPHLHFAVHRVLPDGRSMSVPFVFSQATPTR